MGGRPEHYGKLRQWVEDHLSHQGEDCLIWPFNRSSHGYAMIRYEGRVTLATRVICEKVRGPAPTSEHEAAHSCGRGHLGCVHPQHLHWKTPKQNQADRIAHGTHLRGSNSPSAKLSESEVMKIVKRLDAGDKLQDIADDFRVSIGLISCIKLGKAWGWLTRKMPANA